MRTRRLTEIFENGTTEQTLDIVNRMEPLIHRLSNTITLVSEKMVPIYDDIDQNLIDNIRFTLNCINLFYSTTVSETVVRARLMELTISLLADLRILTSTLWQYTNQ